MLKSGPWSRLLGIRVQNRSQRSCLGPQEMFPHPQEESGALGGTGQATTLLIVTASVSGAGAGGTGRKTAASKRMWRLRRNK